MPQGRPRTLLPGEKKYAGTICWGPKDFQEVLNKETYVKLVSQQRCMRADYIKEVFARAMKNPLLIGVARYRGVSYLNN